LVKAAAKNWFKSQVAVRFVAGPKSGVPAAKWTDIGALKDIATGTPTKREVVIQQNSGWGRFNSLRSVWIVKRDHETMVFSAACPHLGCTIDATANGFACPCHGSPGAQAAENSVVRRRAISTFWKAGSTAIR
jgi:Rieske Fe-S protein